MRLASIVPLFVAFFPGFAASSQVTCLQGLTGPKGPAGYTGPRGPVGPVGIPGTNGIPGLPTTGAFINLCNLVSVNTNIGLNFAIPSLDLISFSGLTDFLYDALAGTITVQEDGVYWINFSAAVGLGLSAQSSLQLYLNNLPLLNGRFSSATSLTPIYGQVLAPLVAGTVLSLGVLPGASLLPILPSLLIQLDACISLIKIGANLTLTEGSLL